MARVRSAGAGPSSRADTIRGERKASGARSRTCRSILPSRRAIVAKLTARPWATASTHLHAFLKAWEMIEGDGILRSGLVATRLIPLTQVALHVVS